MFSQDKNDGKGDEKEAIRRLEMAEVYALHFPKRKMSEAAPFFLPPEKFSSGEVALKRTEKGKKRAKNGQRRQMSTRSLF